MPGRFSIFILLVMFCIFSYSPALAEEIGLVEEIGKSSSNWSNEEQQSFAAMLRGFELYEALVNDIKEYEGYRIAVHGLSDKDARDFLAAGFEAELAANIIEAYLQWVPELQKMAVIPCDGIPTLDDSDIEMLTCSHSDKSTIVFQRFYEDCYSKGDRYRFSVTLHLSPQGWRIKQLDLEEPKK